MTFGAGDRVRLTRPVRVQTDRLAWRLYALGHCFTVREVGAQGVWCDDGRGNRVPLPADALVGVPARDEAGAT